MTQPPQAHSGDEPRLSGDHSLRGQEPGLGGVTRLPALLKALEQDDYRVRRRVLASLEHIQDPVAVPLLAPFLDHHNDQVRKAIVETVGRCGGPDAIGHLIDRLSDSSVMVRKAAAGALLNNPDLSALHPLIHTLRDNNPLVREAAARALGRLGDPHALDALLYAANDLRSQVRAGVMTALGEIASRQPDLAPVVGGHILNAFSDSSQLVRTQAFQAMCVLGTHGWDYVVKGLKSMNPNVRKLSLESMTIMLHDAPGTLLKQAVEQLDRALSDHDGSVRYAAVVALEHLASQLNQHDLADQVVPSLIRCLGDDYEDSFSLSSHIEVKHTRLSNIAARTLLALGTPQARQAVALWKP